MKKIFFITFLIVGLTAGYGFAQMGGHMGSQGMMGSQGHQQSDDKPYAEGYYPCPKMMGGGMGPGMMGSGVRGQQGFNTEEYQKFMDDTASLRKNLHNKKFEYFEARRNPDTTRDALLKIEKEIRDIQWEIYVKSVK